MISMGLLKLQRLLKNAIQILKKGMVTIPVFFTIYCKTVTIYLTQIAKTTKVETKLTKLALSCAKFEINEAIGLRQK
jgi:hypothetical protein